MIERCQKADLPEPEFKLTDGFVTTLRRQPERAFATVGGEVGGQVAPPVAPPVTPPLEVLVRLQVQAGALGNAEMRKHLGLKDRTHLRERYLDLALSGLPVLHGPRGVSPVCGQRDPRPGCTVRTRLI